MFYTYTHVVTKRKLCSHNFSVLYPWIYSFINLFPLKDVVVIECAFTCPSAVIISVDQVCSHITQ